MNVGIDNGGDVAVAVAVASDTDSYSGCACSCPCGLSFIFGKVFHNYFTALECGSPGRRVVAQGEHGGLWGRGSESLAQQKSSVATRCHCPHIELNTNRM